MSANEEGPVDSNIFNCPPIPDLLHSVFDDIVPDDDDDNGLFGQNDLDFRQPSQLQTGFIHERLSHTPEYLRAAPLGPSTLEDPGAFGQIEDFSAMASPHIAQYEDHHQKQSQPASGETPAVPDSVEHTSRTKEVSVRLATRHTTTTHAVPGIQQYTGSSGVETSSHTPQTPFSTGYAPAGEMSPVEQDDAISEPDDSLDTMRSRSRSIPVSASSVVRNRSPVRRSDDHVHISSGDRSVNHLHTIDGTFESGRNLLALFDHDEQPRTRCRIRVERARTGTTAWPGYPAANQAEIPAGITLEQVCERFPNHVWGSGIRMFMHESWNADRIWRHLPGDARHDKSRERPHNYLQQAIGREKDKMHQETNNGEKRQVVKRKRNFGDENSDVKPSKRTKQMQTPQQLADATPMMATASHSAGHQVQPGFRATAFGTGTSFSGAPASLFGSTAPKGSLTGAGPSYVAQTTVRVAPHTTVTSQQAQQAQQGARNRSASVQELDQLVREEEGHQDWITRQILALRGRSETIEARWLQQLHNDRQIRNERDVQLLMQTHGFVGRSPVSMGDAFGMIGHILRYGTPQQHAEPLSERVIHWRALNWWLQVLKARTRNMRTQLAQLQREVNQAGLMLSGGL